MVYCRYYAKGGVRFAPTGGETKEAHGDMIYEYAYMGQPDPAALRSDGWLSARKS